MKTADEKKGKHNEYSAGVFELKKEIPKKILPIQSIAMLTEFLRLIYLNSTKGVGRLIPQLAKICLISLKIFMIFL